MLTCVRQFIRKMIFPTSTHEKVYIVNLDDYPYELTFSKALKKLGKWYITNGNHWICHSDLSFDDFKVSFLSINNLDKETTRIHLSVDYLPFAEILG